MILVDTQVWVEHLRRGLPRLATHLQEGKVLLLFERERPMGRGIGSVDAQLLAAARLSHGRLWTQDLDVQAATTDEEPAEG